VAQRNQPKVRRARTFVVWLVLLEAFWELLVGTFDRVEVLAGLVAAAVGAALALLLADLGLTPRGGFVNVTKLVWQLPVEFAVITWALFSALARGRRVRGRWVRIPYRGDDVLAVLAGTASPNAIVVDIADGEALLHSLAPNLPGGKQVL
jgi:hypothetical protein